MKATIWALVPPILAIIISLITKEVNLSLLVGIIVGAGIYTGFHPFTTITTTFDVMSSRVYSNLGVLYFIVLLGMIVHLMNMSGATHKYAKWASKKLKTRKQTLLATMLLGILIFVDDYFNCLTTGTIMRPITDRHKVSREKLAYIIDSTAAPICIIAPISSWAAAVSSSLPDGASIDGFQLFMKTIACNYYSWFSIILVFLTILFNVDFGKMKKYEEAAQNDTYEYPIDASETSKNELGGILDLIFPILGIIVFSIVSMLYTGGFFDGGVSVADAFANCDAILGLAMGATYTIMFVAILYLPRKIVTPKQFLDGLVQGFINMVPATLILTFAWTLSGICGADYLNAGGFVTNVVSAHSVPLIIMPVLFFVISFLLAFSTGTSWGTFAILLPITIAVFDGVDPTLMVMTTAAVLGGSVCGDNISPISDTTILSSTGAGCDHINHVSTQLQYGALAAITTMIAYAVGGMLRNTVVGMVIGIIILCVAMLGITRLTKKAKISSYRQNK